MKIIQQIFLPCVKIQNMEAKLSVTQEKHKHIYILYSLLIKSKGKDGHFLSRMWLYEEVARFFYTDKFTVGRVINKLQKQHYNPTQIDMEEFFEQLGELVEISGI